MNLPSKYSFIELNPELEKILNIIQDTNDNLCVLGAAGVGKSLTIQLLSDREFYNHNTIVCCPTGISAINASTENIKAQTIHSLFRLPSMSVIPVDHLKTHSELQDLFVNLHTLIIDEISMVNSDLLTKIVYLLNQYRDGEPTRIIVFGDPSQLAPVVSTVEEQNYLDDIYGSRFFFHSDVFTSMRVVHLNKIYRQSDNGFKEILNRFRMDNATDEDYRVINSRVMDISEFGDNALYVALTNKTVNLINDRELQKNPNPFKVYHGEVSDFHPLPVPKELYLKLDAQVMITANNKSVGYYNGLLGKIVKFNKDTIDVETEYDTFSIEKYKWGKYGHEYDKGSGQIKAYEIGYYKQFPIKVAYALTSHKTQGLTLDKMYLDLERGTFASGQLYTSLSRVRSLDGLGLARSIHKCDSKISGVIKKFYKKIEKTEKSV